MLTGIIIFVVCLIALAMCAGGDRVNSEDVSIGTHRMYGEYRVLYNDGYLSQPFMAKAAKFYASHFGGVIVNRNYNGPHKVLGGRIR